MLFLSFSKKISSAKLFSTLFLFTLLVSSLFILFVQSTDDVTDTLTLTEENDNRNVDYYSPVDVEEGGIFHVTISLREDSKTAVTFIYVSPTDSEGILNISSSDVKINKYEIVGNLSQGQSITIYHSISFCVSDMGLGLEINFIRFINEVAIIEIQTVIDKPGKDSCGPQLPLSGFALVMSALTLLTFVGLIAFAISYISKAIIRYFRKGRSRLDLKTDY